MKKSFRHILILNFGLLIFLTVLVLDIAVIFSVKNYFYSDATKKMRSQAQLNLNYLYRYIDFSKGLDDVVLEDSSTIYEYNTGHIMILNNHGENILSTIGLSENIFDSKEIQDTIKKDGYFASIDKFDFFDHNLVTVALPIRYHGNIIGTAIFQSSLFETENSIKNIEMMMIIFSLTVMVIAFIMSIYMSKQMVNPLGKLKNYASKLAGGDYTDQLHVDGTSEIIALGETMNFMASEIKKRDEIKNEFIANVSHELKTPLTSIKGWAYTLNADSSDKELVSDGLNIIENEADRLTGMVNDLLDFSRLLNNKVTLFKTNFNLEDLLQAVINQFKPRSFNENKSLIFNCNVSKSSFLGDENKLRQVVINLMDNAFKFTTENGQISLDLDRRDDNYIITITDDGEGMEEKDIPHIFEKFYRGQNKNSHAGIGLAIVSEIVNLHNGRILVTSQKGKGSKFEIYLPY